MKENEITFIPVEKGKTKKVDVILSFYPQRQGRTYAHLSFSERMMDLMGDPNRVALGFAGDRIYLDPRTGYKLQRNGHRYYFRAASTYFPKSVTLSDMIGDYAAQKDEECGLYFIEWRGEE